MMTGLAYAQQPGQQQNSDQQSQQLSNRDARQFMQRLERDINQVMQSGNLSRLRQWTQNNVADNAVFSGTRQISTRGQSTGFVAATVTKQDLLRLQRFALGSLDMDNASQNFNIGIQVTDVQPIGESAALVKSDVMESRTLANPQSGNQAFSGNQQFGNSGNQQFSRNQQPFTEGAGGSNDQSSQGQQRFAQRQNQQGRAQLETQATCTHLLERNQNSGNIQIVMGVCNAETQAQ